MSDSTQFTNYYDFDEFFETYKHEVFNYSSNFFARKKTRKVLRFFFNYVGEDITTVSSILS
jgi:uncharacterized protein (DUF927 family)